MLAFPWCPPARSLSTCMVLRAASLASWAAWRLQQSSNSEQPCSRTVCLPQPWPDAEIVPGLRKALGDGVQPVKLGCPPQCLKSGGREACSGRRHYRIGEIHSSFPPSRYSLWGRSTGSCTLFLLQGANLLLRVGWGYLCPWLRARTLVKRQGTARWPGRSEVRVLLQRSTDLSIDLAHGLPVCSSGALQVPTKTDASCKQ